MLTGETFYVVLRQGIMYSKRRENSSYSLIRLNMGEAVVPESFVERAIGIGGDMAKAITDIRGLVL